MANLKEIAATLAILGSGALLFSGCKKEGETTEVPGGDGAATGDAAGDDGGGDAAGGDAGGEGGGDAAGEGGGEAKCGEGHTEEGHCGADTAG
ncbi:MAG TPA: hypothetical protein VG755_14880 [Nannocystaceae bacterium]|nr:hypothetical protein [Nannocystaceae bacterium]